MERLGKCRTKKHKKIMFDKLYFQNTIYYVTILAIVTLIIMTISSAIAFQNKLSTPNVEKNLFVNRLNFDGLQDKFANPRTDLGLRGNDLYPTNNSLCCNNYNQFSPDYSRLILTNNSIENNYKSDNKNDNFGMDYDRGCFGKGDNSSVVVDRKSKQILYGQNVYQSMPMASTTKIMTALVVLENSRLDKWVKIPKQAVGVEGSSIYLKENEEWTVQDLLYGLMLRSGNDAATALAIEVGGSVEKFVEMMNDKAKDMGLEHTHFTNPHGLHESGHFTSSYDLAMIACSALDNPDFAKIVSAKSFVVDANDTHPKVVFVNKNKMLSMFEGCDGVKTGYTKVAGKCLVSSATRGDMSLVCVTINNPNMWQDSMHALDMAFKEYTVVKLLDKNKDLFVLESEGQQYRFRVDQDLHVAVKKNQSIDAEYFIDCSQFSTNTISQMQNVGKIYIKLNNRLIFCRKISSIDNIKDKRIILSLPGVVGGGSLGKWYGETQQIFGSKWRSISSWC